MASPEIALSARGLRFGYGDQPVLDGLDLDVAAGEIVGLIGPNGCGKSTMIRILSGLLEPAAGTVSLFDRPLASMNRREIACQLAVVPQDNVDLVRRRIARHNDCFT